MKRPLKYHIAAFLILTVLLSNQICKAQITPLNNYLTESTKLFERGENPDSSEEILNRLSKHFHKLERVEQRKRSKEQFLHSLFFQTSNRFFKNYDPSASFQDMIIEGEFGCVPGTALLTMLLEYFDFNYSIVELTNHVYLEVSSNGKNYVLESTDLMNGFIKVDNSLKKEIEPSINTARINNSLSSVGADGNERSSNFVNEGLSLKQLAGLQYYNQSIYSYYDENLVGSLKMVTWAREMYESDRTEKMMQFVISTILRSKKISSEAKKKYLNQYIRQVQNKRLSQTL